MKGQQETSREANQAIIESGFKDALTKAVYDIAVMAHSLGKPVMIFELTEQYKILYPDTPDIYANDLSKRVSDLYNDELIVYGAKRKSPRSNKMCAEIIPTFGDRKVIAEYQAARLERELSNAKKAIVRKEAQLLKLRDELGRGQA